jgi:hypothetical protein
MRKETFRKSPTKQVTARLLSKIRQEILYFKRMKQRDSNL